MKLRTRLGLGIVSITVILLVPLILSLRSLENVHQTTRKLRDREFAGYLVLQASLPVNVVLGQELSPRHSGIISSLLMGAAWGLGAILLYPIGIIADHAGLEVALATLSALVVVGFVCATQISRHREPMRLSVDAPESAS